jgi:hypothetical protein
MKNIILRRFHCRAQSGLLRTSHAFSSLNFRTHVWIGGSRACSSKSSSGFNYEGQFGGRIRWLRRLSLGSSIVSASAYPLLTALDIPLKVTAVGAVAIFGTAFATSFSSTIFLHFLTSPYVISMKEIDGGSKSAGNPSFICQRANMLGALVETEFSLEDCTKVTGSIHPFASFSVDGGEGKASYYYVYGGKAQEANEATKEIFRKLTNEL